MTTILSVPSQAYAPGTQTLPFSGLTSAEKFITATLTRESWPIGIVANLKITFPNGLGANFNLSGDSLKDKTGAERTTQSLGLTKPAGITSGSVVVTILQSMRTAVAVDMA